MEGMTEEPMAAPEYNGGATEGAPDLAGQPIALIDVPKLIGIGYFNATTLGQQQAAEELGNVTVTTDGPSRRRHRPADRIPRTLYHAGRRWHPVCGE